MKGAFEWGLSEKTSNLSTMTYNTFAKIHENLDQCVFRKRINSKNMSSQENLWDYPEFSWDLVLGLERKDIKNLPTGSCVLYQIIIQYYQSTTETLKAEMLWCQYLYPKRQTLGAEPVLGKMKCWAVPYLWTAGTLLVASWPAQEANSAHCSTRRLHFCCLFMCSTLEQNYAYVVNIYCDVHVCFLVSTGFLLLIVS